MSRAIAILDRSPVQVLQGYLEPSPDHKKRLLVAQELTTAEGTAVAGPSIILCGLGRHKLSLSSASIAQKWSERSGLFANCKVHLEENSRDTVGNLLFIGRLCKKYKLNDLTVVTSDFHVSRVRTLLSYLMPRGIPNVSIECCSTDLNDPERRTELQEARSLAEALRWLQMISHREIEHPTRLLREHHQLYRDVIQWIP